MAVPSRASALEKGPRRDGGTLVPWDRWRTSTVAVLLVLLMVGSAVLILAQGPLDPLAKFRAPDGSLRIPGGALTPELQRLIFQGNDIQPTLNLSYYAPARSPYRTAELVLLPYLTPNPNVVVRSSQQPKSLAQAIADLLARWFPPVDWTDAFHSVSRAAFGLFFGDARAIVTIDTTTVTDISAAANTCTTSQTTGVSDNAVIVLLSERGTTTFLSVTYGTVNLTLIASTAANGGTVVRTEIWGFAGVLPTGTQTMTATLSGGANARMTCATVLLVGVKSTGSFINGTTAAGNSANGSITLAAPVTAGNLGIAVLALQNTGGAGAKPSAVAGTGAAATDLYGVGIGHCTGGGAGNECAAGASIPNPGTAVAWTHPSTQWVISAVEVVAIPTCGTVGGGPCYRIGNGGTWTSTSNWSNTSGGPSCGCAPLATDIAIFDTTPTGTTSLSGATTIAALDMTGFTGTLDATNANNWALTVNGNFTIQGTYLPRGSTVTVSGNVTILGTSTVVTMSTSAWTVNGTWTNNSTSAAWSAGTSSVTIADAASGALTFANLSGGTNEFNNLTLDATVAAGITYTMAVNGLRMGGTLVIQNSSAGATGPTLLDTSAANLAVTAGALTIAAWGAANTRASAIAVNGATNISATSGYLANTGGTWTVTGAWTDASTSGSWSFQAAITFRSGVSRTMTYGPQAGNEFAGAVTFDTSAAGGVTYTLGGTNPLDLGGVLTIQNSVVGATGAVALNTSAANLAVNAGGLVESTWGAFNSRASTVSVGGDVGIAAANAYITNSGGSWTVAGAWTNATTSGLWSFAAAMTFHAAAAKTMTFTGSNIAGNEFLGPVTFDTPTAAGVSYTMAAGATGDASLRVGGGLTILNTAAGATGATILDTSTGNFAITTAFLTLGSPRGALRSEGSQITVNGNVTIADTTSYLVLGSATWSVAGSWTNGSTDSADWSAGTGTVTFRGAASATMRFANLAANELNNVVFDTSNALGITYTMSTNGLMAAGTFTVQNTAGAPTGNVVVTTGASLPLAVGSVILGTRGTLTANGSTITVNGSWTSTAANHVWNPGTSTVVFAATGTVTMAGGESFANLTQGTGTTTLGSNLTVSGTTVVNGTLDSSASNFTLTLQGALSVGAAGVLNLRASSATTAGNVTIAAGGAVRFTGAGTWTVNGTWTDSNTAVPASWSVASSTVRFVGGGAMTLTFWTAPGSEFNNLVLDSSLAAGFTYSQVNALQAAGTVTIQNTAGGATGPVLLDASAGNYGATTGGLTLGALGGYVSRGAGVSLNGNVSVAANAYATSLATGTWTVTGSWTNGSTSASWSFLAPITFRSGAAQTMTFKATGTEFGGAVIFDTTAVAGVTYTMATNGLSLAGLLTIRNSAVGATGNTVLDTSASGRSVAAGALTLGTNGTLRANGSTITVGGNWTATAVNATFIAGTSTVVVTAGATITMAQAFNNLTITAGTSTLAANTTVNAALTVSGGLLAKTTFTLSASSLILSGGGLTSTSGAATVTGNVNISAAASYIAFGSETWTVGGSWTNSSTSASWSAGTGTLVFDSGSASTMTFAGTNLTGNEFNSVTFDTPAAGGVVYTMAARGLRIATALLIRNSTPTPTGNAVLDTSAAGLAIAAGSVTIGANGTLTANGSAITVAGSWTSTAAGAVFNAGTSTVTLAAAGTIALGATQAFNALAVTAGTVTQTTQVTASSLTISGGTLAKGSNTLTVNGGLTLSGGSLTSTSGSATVTGNVTVSAAASYIAFGSETWTITGTWSNASTSASWSAGSGTVTFTPGGSGTYTFGNLGASEFNNLVFSPTAAAVVTMATHGLRWGGALVLNANATLATTGLSLTGGSLTVGNGATLTANASAVSVGNVSMTGGTSGTLTLTTGAWTVSGNWDTSGAGSAFNSGSSSVTLSGAARTVKTLAGEPFATLTVSGTVTQASDLKATALTVTGTLTKTGFAVLVNSLTAAVGTIADGAVNVTGFTVTDNDPTAVITFSLFSTWTANTQYAWTHTDSKTTDTITFTISGQTGVVYNVTKNGVLFTNGTITGGNITFTMLGSDPDVVVTPSGCGGSSRYWILGTGSWSQTSHWASSSGGVGGCSLPGNGTDVFFDANSGSGTVTVDMSDSVATLTTTGSTIGTIALGTNSLTTSGNVTHAAGTITIGASAGTGLSVGGSLTLSGAAALDGSGAASILNVTGSVTISSATAYLRMGSGTWTVSGAWSNASTSASWAAGTGTVVFNAATSQTMTFAGTNLATSEFNNVTFNSGAATATFTLSTRGLNVAALVTVQGGTGVTTVDLSAGNLPLTTTGITIGAGGVLNGRGSAIAVSGNWDSHLGTFAAGTSTVSLTGAARTLNTASPFAGLTVSGSYTQASAVTAGATGLTGSLNTSASSFALTTGDLTITGTLTGNASPITVSGNWDSHLGTFAAGTSTVTLTGASKTVNTASVFAGLTVSGSYTMASAITAGATLVSGSLSTSGASYSLTVGDLTITGSVTANGSAITVSGNWDSHLGTFAAGTSTVTLTGTAKTANTASSFGTLVVSGSYTMASALTAGATTISGSLNTSATSYALAAGSLTITGTLSANGSALSISGNWDSHLGTFTAGTSTVTMSGGSTTLNTANGFATLHVTGTVTAASAVTAGTALNIDTGGSLDLSTSNFALTAVSLTLGATGTLIGRGSTITITSMDTHLGTFTVGTTSVVVSASGGILNVPQTFNNLTVNPSVTTTISSNLTWSGALTLNGSDAVTVTGNLTSSGAAATLSLASAALTVSGNWDTSAMTGSFNAGTSTVTLNGAAKTYKTAAGQTLYAATFGGSLTLASDVTANSLVVTGTLTKTSFSLVFNALTVTAGSIVDGTVTASNLTVSNSEATALTTISVFSVWAANVQYGWTHTSSSTTTTITFTITSVTGSVYNVMKDGSLFLSGSVTGGQIQFTMLGSDPVILVNLSGCTGADEYWILGTGNWNDPAHWATSSGGVGGCPAPLSTINAHIDSNSGTGTITVNVDVSIASLTTSGSTIATLALGTHSFSVTGSVTHAAGTITLGASAGTGLGIGGNLTLSGTAVLDGSSGSSVVGVTGATSVTSAAAYVRMGSGTWTFGGAWSNGSTSSSWAPGTGTVVFRAGANAAITFGNLPGNEFNDLRIDTTAPGGVTYTMATNGLKVGGTLTVQNSTASPTGNTNLVTSGLAVAAVSVTIGTNGTVSAGSSTITVGGGWTATAANATFVGGTSTVILGATSTLAMTSAFYNLTVTAGTVGLGAALAVGNALTVSGGTLAKSTFTLSATSLTLSGGALTSTSGNVAVSGNVSISAAASYIAFGSETWTVSGSWTNGSTSASWSSGTGGILFNASTAQTMTFAGTNLAGSEFNNATFNAGASTVTFTMGSRGLRTAGTVTIGGGSAVTTLNTGASGLPVTALALNAIAGGSLTSNGSTFTITSMDTHLGSFAAGASTVVVNASGGTVNVPQTLNSLTVASGVSTTFASSIAWSGLLTLTGATAAFASDLTSSGPAGLTFGSASLIVAGAWNTASATTFTSTGSTVTFTGAAKTITLAAVQSLATVNVTGTYTLGGPLAATGLLTVGGTLDTSASGYALTAAGLTVTGASGILRANGSAVGITGSVTIDNAAGYITASAAGSWTVANGSWTDSSASASWAFAAAIVFRSDASRTMTFGAMAQEFGGSVTFDSGVAAGVTYTMAMNALHVGGALTIQNTSPSSTAPTVLTTSASNLAVSALSLALTATGALTANGSTVTVRSIDTHLGTFNAGASIVIVDTSGGSVNISQTVHDLTVNPGVLTSFTGSLTWAGALTLTGATVDFGANNVTSSGPATIVLSSATITLGDGNWDTSSATAFTATGSSVTFSGTGTLNAGAGASFSALTISGGTRSMLGALSADGLLTLSGGLLVKGTSTLTANAGLVLSGGALTSVSGPVAIAGDVVVSSASSYIALGSEAWTVSGTWTNASTSVSWSAGTGAVTFDAGSSRTMTFAALPGGAPEFHDVVFDSGAATTTFTMAGTPLTWSGTLGIQGATGTTTLNTGDLGLSGGAISIGDGGILLANASPVAVSDVSMVGASSGTLTVTTGTWTVSGNWNTSGPGSTLSLGTSAATFAGTSATLQLGTGQSFYNVIVAGSLTLASHVVVTAALTIADGAVLTKTGFDLGFNGLSEVGTGRIVDGSVTATGLTVANSDPMSTTTISVFSAWIPNRSYTWTHASSVATSMITFTLRGSVPGYRFDVTKDGAAFTTGFVDGSGNVTFTMLGSDPVVDVIVAAPCASIRYWVAGAGAWSQTAHWSATSGGAGGCQPPTASSTVYFDANSGSGVLTLDRNDSIGSLDTTGWTGTFALGAYNLAIAGTLLLAGGTMTIGASAGTGLTVGGDLVVSGSAVLDGSGAASFVTVAGNASITGTGASFRMGTGTWTFAGSWSNGSTSASWSAGTGTVVFTSSVSRTMTFGALPGNEFYHVTFASSAASGTVAFTMGTNALRWGGLLTVQDTAGSTTTLATSSLALAGGSIGLGNGGLLVADGSSVAVADVTMTGGTSGSIAVTTGTWTVSGNWNTSGAGSTYTKGTGTVILSGANRTLAVRSPGSAFYNLTITGTVVQSSAVDVTGTLTVRGTWTSAGYDLTGGAGLVISGGGRFDGSTSSVAVGSVTMNDASANVLSLTAGAISVAGSWDSSGASSLFTSGTSTVTLSGPSSMIALGPSQSFAALVITGTYSLSTPVSALSLTIAAGGLGKGTNGLTVGGDLVLSGGYLTSTSGDVSVAGSVNVSSPSSYVVFGSEAWTVSGSWTNASTSSSWSAGTGIVTFNAGSSRTMGFAGTNLPGNEFNDVALNGGASTITFMMAGSTLRAHSVLVRGGTGTTTLDTSTGNLGIAADIVTVGPGGVLQANGSTVTVGSIDTSAGGFVAGASLLVISAGGGTVNVPQTLNSLTVGAGLSTTFLSSIVWMGTLTLSGVTVSAAGNLMASGPATFRLDSAVVTLAGSWDTSSASVVTTTGSSVTFTGVAQTLTLGPGQAFASLIIGGTVALASDLTAARLTVNAGATLTEAGHAITFNALAAAGTLSDGSVLVSGLTVTNSDTTALVTISSFTTWRPGAEYAWSHTSSETTQTITWTIGGNTAGFLYHVTKDGSSFANGVVDGAGSVVFSMVGSDPAMQVVVSAPPVPPWWTSPFFLSSLPFPFIVVVAMFVQRRRWKPTKAFLVDERGQLLREFTLDSSCTVTYNEALEAGALDAVEKDVRVAKYHARTVRGDMLSLVMLAVGPADVEEVEFARGILVSVQDKLEDRVKARVQEARSEEATLASAREEAENELADLKTRSRVFGDMLNAFTIARRKLDVDSKKLHGADLELRDREARLEEGRGALKEQEGQLDAERKELSDTAAGLESERQELGNIETGLRQREASLGPKEKALKQRASEITKRESQVAAREEELEGAQAKLASDLEDYHGKVALVDAAQAELAEERKSLDDLSVQLDKQQTTLAESTAAVEAREKEAAATVTEFKEKLGALEPREEAAVKKESELSARESAVTSQESALETETAELRRRLENVRAQAEILATRSKELDDERKETDRVTAEAAKERKALDEKAALLAAQEVDLATKGQGLADLKANLDPREATVLEKETELAEREQALTGQREALQSQQDLVAAKAFELQQQFDQVKEREESLEQEKMILRDAKAAFDAERHDLDESRTRFAEEVKRADADAAAQAKKVEDEKARLAKTVDEFEAQKLEKNQWIASKEIELEAKEQSLADREAEIRAQAEENARRFTEVATREEEFEIDQDKLEKTRAEIEVQLAEQQAKARDLDARAVKLRDEEARKGEELHTWQSTLESEQALLKEQQETFEKEMQELRESWAGRMIRVEQREEELKERETKIQADVEWVARNEAELGKREKAAAETLRTGTELKAEGERLRKELEQRALEVESRDLAVREEAANQSIELEKRTEALQASEAELAGRRAEWEREAAAEVKKLKAREAELQERDAALSTLATQHAAKESALAGRQETLEKEAGRLTQDRADLAVLEKQIEAKQLELSQSRERFDADSERTRTEFDAVRQSLAAKEADLRSERERLERESTSLQDKLGAKARDLATREKAIAGGETDLRTREESLAARLRETESRERQLEARGADVAAKEKALSDANEALKARSASFDSNVQKFDAESATRQKEWAARQQDLKSQQAQLAADAQARQADIKKRMEALEQKENSLNASLTQAQIERGRLDTQAKTLAAKEQDLAAAAARAEARSAELKAMEDDRLKARQTFEIERTAWANRRSEELKQLEATRDAAADQTQQAERLIEEAQRRAYMASEAEKGSKRQAADLATAQAELERRRSAAEKAEKDLQTQMAQLRTAMQELGGKEMALDSRSKQLDAFQARLSEAEKKGLAAADDLKARKVGLDREADRLTSVAAGLDKHSAELATRASAVEARLAEAAKREQVLTTELQRADNLIADLNRKDAELVARQREITATEQDIAKKAEGQRRREAEIAEGMETLQRLRKEHDVLVAQSEADFQKASKAKAEVAAISAEAAKMRTQAETMQAEVSKNMRFLQKKALDVLDREEKIRTRENRAEEEGQKLTSRSELLEKKERSLTGEKDELGARLDKANAEIEKLKAKLADAEKAGKATVDLEEWKRDIDNRVKIIQKKALDLLDREEKLRKKEAELKTLEEQIKAAPKA